MAVINAYRIWACLCCCCCCCCCYCSFSLMILVQGQLLFLYLVVPADVANAFTNNSPLQGGCHQTCNDDDDDDNDNDYYSRKRLISSWLLERNSLETTKNRRHGKRLFTILQLEATKWKSGQEWNIDVDADEQTTNIEKKISNKQDTKWLKQYENLKAFRETHGTCNVPVLQGRLGGWVHRQRKALQQDKMRDNRKALLNGIGFVWNGATARSLTYDHKWKKHYNALKLYNKDYGHWNVPQNGSKALLGNWGMYQCYLFHSDRLPKEQVNLLDEIGFTWIAGDKVWQISYKMLEEFCQIHGHFHVPSKHHLLYWTSKQRLDHAAGRLAQSKKAMLDELGFIWEDPEFERRERQWEDMFDELEQYKSREGHVLVPISDSLLGFWVSRQQKLYHDNCLLEHRQEKLESIGLVWRLRESSDMDMTTWDMKWMKKYDELKQFRTEHGHVNVPYRESLLGTWVNHQCALFRKDKLREDRKELLDEVGFQWERGQIVKDQQFQARYVELQSYKKDFGDTSAVKIKNPALYRWFCRQQILEKARRLESKQKPMLDKQGIEEW